MDGEGLRWPPLDGVPLNTYTLHPNPSTLYTYTLHPNPSILNNYALLPNPSTLNPAPSALTPHPHTHLSPFTPPPQTQTPYPYRGTSPIRNRTPLGPYRRPRPRAL